MTYPCPNCGSPATLETGCPSCGRGPDPDAAEVIRTDAEITTLITELATARTAVATLENRIGQAWHRRNAAAARVRAAAGPQPQPETSSRAVQNLLFTLGGLLLGVAAIVFTVVAWSQFGVTGRATLLLAVTVVALAVPPLALRRGLKATAETMAAVGVLLTLLCGYAAWSVDLFGVAGGSPVRYAGAVCLLTAAIATGYALVTGLHGPRWQALLIFQPALPLLVHPSHPGLAAWSLTFGAIAAVDLAVRRALAPLAYACALLATLFAALPAVISGLNTLAAAQPFFQAPWFAAVPYVGWTLPVALAAVTAALFATVPPSLRPASLVAGAAAIALALPAGLHLPWWNAPIIDLVVIAGVLTLAAHRAAPVLHAPAARAAALSAAASPSTPSAAASAVTLGARVATSATAVAFVTQLATAVLLAAHALFAAFGRPAIAAGALIALALFGAALAVCAQRPVLAGAGLFTALVALPPIAWTTTAALALAPAAQALFVTAASALTLLLLALADRPAAADLDRPPARLLATVLGARFPGGRLGTFAGTASVARRAAAVPLGLTLLAVLPGLTPVIGTTVVLGVIMVAGAAVGAAGRTRIARGIGVAVAVAVGLDATVTRPAGTVLESYALVASGLALAAALLAKRDHSSSWTIYGPALIIGLVPSLGTVLTNDEGQHLRRLLLGTAALVVLLVGAKTRLRAPVIVGGTVLAVVAVHELALVWDLIPRWIPLAAGGLLLVLLAATLEARRRDLARFRHAIHRMS